MDKIFWRALQEKTTPKHRQWWQYEDNDNDNSINDDSDNEDGDNEGSDNVDSVNKYWQRKRQQRRQKQLKLDQVHLACRTLEGPSTCDQKPFPWNRKPFN